MIFIRVTLKTGQTLFVSETRHYRNPGIILVKNTRDALRYEGTLEFKVTWKYYELIDDISTKEDIIKFEKIDIRSLRSRVFDINKQEIKIDKTIKIDYVSFEKLINCPITDSCFCYDNLDNWIAFTRTASRKALESIVKIRYYARGITFGISNYNNWLDRHSGHSWHKAFERHHTLMMHPIIQQIYLLQFPACHEITFIKNNINA